MRSIFQISFAAMLMLSAFTATTLRAEGTLIRKGKRRVTPYNPTWSPSKCGTIQIKRVPNRRKNYRVPSGAAIELDDIDGVKKKLETLRRIHEIQMKLVKNNGKISRQQQARLRKKIRQLQPELEKDIGNSPDFPFPTQLLDMDQMLLGDGNGLAKYPHLVGRNTEDTLKKIQREQTRALKRALQKKTMTPG